jgi:hypothetical protein
MERKDYIILILIIALVAIVSFTSAYFLAAQPKNIINNSNNSSLNTTSNNTTTNQTTPQQTSKTSKSESSGVSLKGFTLFEIRQGYDYTNICKYCKKKGYYHTVYDYYNNAGDRKMVGEYYCPKCGHSWRDWWQNGKWHDL